MKININLIEAKINGSSAKNVLANASIILTDEHQRKITISGFNIRKSKYNNGKPYLELPNISRGMGKGFFRFMNIEKSLKDEIEKEVLQEYKLQGIPVIDDEDNFRNNNL